MERINSELNQPNIAVPRLTYNRVFGGPGEMAGYAEAKDGILDVLNDAIAQNPAGVLDDIAWLEDQLADGTPIATRPFIAIKEGREEDGWAAQRTYIGAIRDALSITSNGSQFEFGHTMPERERNWATVFDTTNEIDRAEIASAQTRVFETQTMVRRYRQQDQNGVPDAEVNLGIWETKNTVAKQQRALIRLRALATIARGPEAVIPDQAGEAPADEVVAGQSQGRMMRAAGALMRAASVFTF